MNIKRTKDVCKLFGFSRTTLHREIKKGNFPKPIKLSTRCVGWPEEEVEAFIQKKLKERTA